MPSLLPIHYAQSPAYVAEALVDDDLLLSLSTSRWQVGTMLNGKWTSSPKRLVSTLNPKTGGATSSPIYLNRLVYLMRKGGPSISVLFSSKNFEELFPLLDVLPRLTMLDGQWLNCLSSNIIIRRGASLVNRPRQVGKLPDAEIIRVTHEARTSMIEKQETIENLSESLRQSIGYPYLVDQAQLKLIFDGLDEDTIEKIKEKARDTQDQIEESRRIREANETTRKASSIAFNNLTGLDAKKIKDEQEEVKREQRIKDSEQAQKEYIEKNTKSE